MKSSEKHLRVLIREIISEGLVDDLKSAFSGFNTVLQNGYKEGESSGDSNIPYSVDRIEQLALDKNDSTFESLAKHALFIYDVANALQKTKTLSSDTLGFLENSSDALNLNIIDATDEEVQEFLSAIQQLTTKIGSLVGSSHEIISKGASGGKQAVQQRLSQFLKVGKNNSETLKNISNFIKEIEILKLEEKFNELIQSETAKKWIETNRGNYGTDADLIEKAVVEFLPSIKSNMSTCKTQLELVYDMSLNLEKTLPEIEKAAINQKAAKEEEAKEEDNPNQEQSQDPNKK